MTYVLKSLLAGTIAFTICYAMVEIYYCGQDLRTIAEREGR